MENQFNKNDIDLSVLIPARNEMFLSKTVENILQNIRGKTEIIVVLDGAWADPGIPDNERVTIIYHNTSIGQRAATNEACKLSRAKYVMKLDAHCVMDEGFDVKMIAEMKDDYTMIPTMYNLHAFDWVCTGKWHSYDESITQGVYTEFPDVETLGCGHTIYQGPTPEKCPKCGGRMVRKLIWKPRLHRKSNYYRFDKTLHFQYWGDFGNRPESEGDVVPMLSAQGSCFMLTREKYWELDICDERHGSWGQQGVEVACKTWLSGGTLVVNKKTWYSHMFRTQGGDFGFPYPLSGKEVDKARKYSRDLWLNNKWDKAKYDLQWLLNKFAPVPDWHDEKSHLNLTSIHNSGTNISFSEKSEKSEKEIIFYTDNQLNLKIAHAVQRQLKKAEIPIVSASLKSMDFGHNVHLKLQRGYLTMAKQILTALEETKADIIFFCEHDVLYHPSHFDFIPEKKDVYYYNTNVWRVRSSDGFSLYVDDLKQLSGLCAYRETLVKHFKKRVQVMEEKSRQLDEKEFSSFVRAMGFEPGTHGREERIDDLPCEGYKAKHPNIDIRHESNLTPSRWVKEAFRNKRYTQGWKEEHISNIPGWNINNYKDFNTFLSTI